MRKWLIGLAIAGGAGVVALVGRSLSLRKKHSDYGRALAFGEEFNTALCSSVESLTNETKMLPEKGAWVDTYKGAVEQDDFIFEALQFGEPESVDENKPRYYLLQWRTLAVQVSVTQEQEDGPSSIFPRIHRELRRRYRPSKFN